MDNRDLTRISSDLDVIKKLLILSLIQKGFKQKALASTLGVGEATLSEMFPKGLLKEARELADHD